MRKEFTLILALFIILLSSRIYSQTSYTVQVSDFSFTPANLNIMKGDTVKWVWVSGMHTTTSDSTTGIDVWNSPIDQSHPTYSFVFSSPGIHSYYCVYHVSFGMKGTINVQEPTLVKNANQMPLTFALEQNYPNPFNPTTEIKYVISKASFVNLNIYDLLGNKVETLVNRKQMSGEYSVVFNASALPSGVYIYQLEAGNFSDARKMILMK